MTKVTVSRHVPYTADQVFVVASNVAAYREFVPLLTHSTVWNVVASPDGKQRFDAELTVSYEKLGLRETVHSKVEADPAKRTVHAHAVGQGPMKHLDAKWRIEEDGASGCSIVLDIDYVFKSRSLQFILSGMFDMVMRRILSAFEERARSLYGASA